MRSISPFCNVARLICIPAQYPAGTPNAKASVVQPFHYTLVLWAIILGYIFYNDLPDIPTLIGATVITISGIYVLNSRTRSN